MTTHATISADGHTLTIRIPFTVHKRGGQKRVVTPDGTQAWTPSRARIDNTLVKALARAFRWRKMLETGVFATVDEIATAEKINASYVGCVLQLTLLAPEIVEAILDGRQPVGLTLTALMPPLSVGWREQQMVIGVIS